jgi:Rrf2 family transcriptional regulator, iron-sulfur cluster assembly transcription factor
MKLTTKSKFAVTAILDIAIHGDNSIVSLNDISNRHNISISYLEQLFMRLRRAGLVKSQKGPGGGYSLAKPATEINISQVILCVEDNLDARTCLGKKNCRGKTPCIAHELWSNLTIYVHDYLSKISLNDITEDFKNQKNKHYI